MNTFLPFNDFRRSARCLDKKRLFKQLLETYQILNTISGKTSGWKHHPIVKMWWDYPDALQDYYNEFYIYCIIHHQINIIKLPRPLRLPKYLEYPKWLGRKDFHYAMRCNLLRKSLEDLSKGRNELSKRLANEGILLKEHNLNTKYVWIKEFE